MFYIPVKVYIQTDYHCNNRSVKEKTDINVTSTLMSVGEMVAARDLVEFAKTHLPILLGTQVTVFRKQNPRPVHRSN